MSINYNLKKCGIGKDGELFHRAVVKSVGTVGQEELADLISKRVRNLPAVTVISVLRSVAEEIGYQLNNGCSVTLDFAKFRTSIKGKFQGPDDRFDKKRHSVEIKVNVGAALRRVIHARPFPRKVPESMNFFIERYQDISSGKDNGTATPGGSAILHGKDLKFDPADEEQGVFYVSGNGAALRAENVVRVMPSQVILNNPRELEAGGRYDLILRKKKANGALIFVKLDAQLNGAGAPAQDR